MRNPFQIIWEKIHTSKEKYVPPYSPYSQSSGTPSTSWPQVKSEQSPSLCPVCGRLMMNGSCGVAHGSFNGSYYISCPHCKKLLEKGAACGTCYDKEPRRQCYGCYGWFGEGELKGTPLCESCRRIKNGLEPMPTYWDGFKMAVKERCTECNSWCEKKELDGGVCEYCRDARSVVASGQIGSWVWKQSEERT